MKKLADGIVAELERHSETISWTAKGGGSHIKLLLTHRRTGLRRIVVTSSTSSTPSDWRGALNAVASIRRIARELGEAAACIQQSDSSHSRHLSR